MDDNLKKSIELNLDCGPLNNLVYEMSTLIPEESQFIFDNFSKNGLKLKECLIKREDMTFWLKEYLNNSNMLSISNKIYGLISSMESEHAINDEINRFNSSFDKLLCMFLVEIEALFNNEHHVVMDPIDIFALCFEKSYAFEIIYYILYNCNSMDQRLLRKTIKSLMNSINQRDGICLNLNAI